MKEAFAELDIAETYASELAVCDLPLPNYLSYYRSVLNHLDSAWDKAREALLNSGHPLIVGEGDKALIEWHPWIRAEKLRTCIDAGGFDPLLKYLKIARNQAEHRREPSLWVCSDPGEPPSSAGDVVYRPGGYIVRDAKSYAATMLPTLELDFVGARIALLPVADKKGRVIAIPNSHLGLHLTRNDPGTVTKLAVTFYGDLFVAAKSAFEF